MNNREFGNLMHIFELQACGEKPDSYAAMSARQKDLQYRKELFSAYYGLSLQSVDDLLAVPMEKRKSMCETVNVNRYILRTLFDYNSYKDCFFIYHQLKHKVNFAELKILDFGCMVSDYGFFFGKLGSVVTLCDFQEHADFADFRLERTGIHRNKVYAPANYESLTSGINLAVFGEVLEHLVDPYLLLESCVLSNVSFIYTSCYPYGDDVYFNLPGHTKEAQAQSQASIKLLRSHYKEIKFYKFRRLWVRKGNI